MRITNKQKMLVGAGVVAVLAVGSLSALPKGVSADPSLKIEPGSLAAAPDFHTLATDGLVPKNVMDALRLPAGSVLAYTMNYDHNNGDFDRSIVIDVPGTAAQLRTFYLTVFKHFGWTTLSATSSTSSTTSTTVLGRISGSDSNYWEVGIKAPFSVKSNSTALVGIFPVSPSATGRYVVAEIRLLIFSLQ